MTEDPAASAPPSATRPTPATGRIARWIDQRTASSATVRRAADHPFPRHWSFLLGEIALYSFVVLVVTGVFLTFFFEPSQAETVYRGDYEPLRGVRMSHAYASTVELSWDVRAGLVMRQMHHWAALVFVAAVIAHLCRNFFTGAFRRPRDLNWMIGVTLLVLAIFNGFAGYSLVDDMLSGTGLRVAHSIALAVPVVGTWAAYLLFGGEFPADDIIGRLYVFHILLVPVAIATLLAAHLALVWRQRHTQFPGPGRTDRRLVGTRLWPTYAAKSAGLFFLVAGVLAALGGLVQINPVWLWGPYDPGAVTTAAQPDWYMGWIEGAMRLAGPWRLRVGPFTVSELFWPAVLLPGVTFALLYAWPFLDRRMGGDDREHLVLQRPRDHPRRTAFGAAALTFYTVLLVAGSQDVVAQRLAVPITTVLWTLRVAVFVAPLIVGAFTYRLCRDLRDGSGPPIPADPVANARVSQAMALEDAGSAPSSRSSSLRKVVPRSHTAPPRAARPP